MNNTEKLYEKLIKYSRGRDYPFHMPGHKRQMMSMEDPYRFDLTEIDGFDNLHESEGILKAEQERAAKLYSSEETHFMVNGSTGGLLAAIAGVLHPGDRVLVARNCHTSVYHGLELHHLKPVFLWPELDETCGIYQGISKKMVEEKLKKYPDIQAVILTSPTYEGILSDVTGICEAAHRRGIPCIVDEAHGAHLRWIGIPDSVSCQADVVIQSLHKTMPALTQTALIHLNGSLISKERIRRMLTFYQTSSPSYVLMASICQCMDWLELCGERSFDQYKTRLISFRKELEGLQNLHIYIPQGPYDWGKLVICTPGEDMNGRYLYNRLKDIYQLQMEMASSRYVLAMTTVGDEEDGLDRLLDALKETDKFYRPETLKINKIGHPVKAQKAMEIYEAAGGPVKRQKLYDSAGHVAGDYIYLYPPGVPLLVPGEVIQKEHIEQMEYYLSRDLEIYGGYDKRENTLTVAGDSKVL